MYKKITEEYKTINIKQKNKRKNNKIHIRFYNQNINKPYYKTESNKYGL